MIDMSCMTILHLLNVFVGAFFTACIGAHVGAVGVCVGSAGVLI